MMSDGAVLQGLQGLALDPFSVRVEQMITGMGRWAMILRRKVMPSTWW